MSGPGELIIVRESPKRSPRRSRSPIQSPSLRSPALISSSMKLHMKQPRANVPSSLKKEVAVPSPMLSTEGSGKALSWSLHSDECDVSVECRSFVFQLLAPHAHFFVFIPADHDTSPFGFRGVG